MLVLKPARQTDANHVRAMLQGRHSLDTWCILPSDRSSVPRALGRVQLMSARTKVQRGHQHEVRLKVAGLSQFEPLMGRHSDPLPNVI